MRLQAGHHGPKKARSNVEVMLIVLFDSEGVVHHEFLPQGKTVNKKYYLEVTQRLCESIRRKGPNALMDD